jgi:hypothetical protein
MTIGIEIPIFRLVFEIPMKVFEIQICILVFEIPKKVFEIPNICLKVVMTKVGVLRASHKISNSDRRICWNDASKFSSISSLCISRLFVVFENMTGPGRSDDHDAGALN